MGVGELEVSGANFHVEEESFRHLCVLSQAKSTTPITSKHATTSVVKQARGCRAKRFKKLIETDPWRIANTIKYAFREASFSGSIRLPDTAALSVKCRAEGGRIACSNRSGCPTIPWRADDQLSFAGTLDFVGIF